MFKLGLDVHGVIDTFTQDFKFLAKSVMMNGGEVHIITGLSKDSDEYRDLVLNKCFPFTHYFSIVDYLIEDDPNSVEWIDGLPYADKDKWNSAKSIYCKNEGISLMIDDSPVYKDTFNEIPTPYLHLINPNRKQYTVRE